MKMFPTTNSYRLLVLAATVLLAVSSATAGTIGTYTGSDDGASTTGPWPMSAAAQTAFLAAAGPTSLLTFESLPVGYTNPLAAAPGVTISFTGPNFGCNYSGVCNSTYGNLYGFNITSGGSQWLGNVEGTTTYSFATPITAFGLYLTGVQTVFTTSFTLTFNDGTAQSLNLPINVNGGASYFGFTDTASFSSVTITNLSDDAWGMDDVSYSTQSSVPEPGTLVMLGSGLAGLASFVRHKFVR